MGQNKIFSILAQVPTGLGGPIGTGEGLGPFSGVGDQTDAITKFAAGFSAIIGFLTVAGGLWFIFQFIIGALQWIGAGGDQKSLQGAQEKITNSLIGLVVVVAAVAVIRVIGTFLDFDILNPASFIEAIRFK